MKLIVGLGNPGAKYEKTRHNAGFMALDLITDNLDWKSRFESLIAFQTKEDTKIVFLKPLTYMNLSGVPVQLVLNFYKIRNKDLIILHDDIDLPLGTVKLKENGGHAGHNGIRSIQEKIGQNFVRVRIGVGRPETNNVSGYVLDEFPDEELRILNQALSKCSLAIKYLIKDSYECCRRIFSIN